MNNKFKIFIIPTLLIVLLVSAVTIYGASASQINESINTKQKELRKGEQEEAALSMEIKNIEARVKATKGEVDKLNGQIGEMQQKVDQVADELDKKEKEIEQSVDGLNQRLRNMYKSGVVGFVDVILSSSNGAELLHNLEMVQKIYAGDKDLVEALEVEYQSIKAEREELEKMQQELVAQKSSLAEKQAALQADQTALANKQSKVSNQNAYLQDEIDDLKAESEAIAKALAGSSAGNSGTYSGGTMTWPVPSSRYVSSPYGNRIHPITHNLRMHTGIDIVAGMGAPIVAASSGTVFSAGYQSGYGNTVIILHGGGISTLYAHNSSLLVSSGQSVSAGETIALAGSTGNSTGPHLHFEVRVNGRHVNPQGGYL